MGILDKLQEAMEDGPNRAAQIDQLVINDEVAAKTDWERANRGGTNVGSHTLRETSPTRFEFKVNAMALLQPMLFIIGGTGAYIFINTSHFGQDAMISLASIPIAGSIVLIGLFKIFRWTEPRVFDRTTNCYWRSRKQPDTANAQSSKKACLLDDIHAIQLLKESLGNARNGGGYASYELNVVLKDSSRLNVVDHSNHSQVRADAEKLSQFLNVPVWDAS